MALFLSDGFENRYFVFYYPALLGLSLMFRRRVSFSVLGVVMALYVTIALTVSPMLDTDLKDEKVLFIRLVTMLGVVVAGTLIAAWERTRPQGGGGRRAPGGGGEPGPAEKGPGDRAGHSGGAGPHRPGRFTTGSPNPSTC